MYKPLGSLNARDERPSKRRKVSKPESSGDDASLPFAHLLDGKETADSVKLRYDLFQQVWSRQDDEIQVS